MYSYVRFHKMIRVQIVVFLLLGMILCAQQLKWRCHFQASGGINPITDPRSYDRHCRFTVNNSVDLSCATTISMTKAYSTKTIVAVAAYCCVVASTTNAFVVPSSHSSPTLSCPKTAPSKNLLFSPTIRPFDSTNDAPSPTKRGNLKAGTTLSSPSSSPSLSSDQKSLLSVGLWCLMDVAFRRLFQRMNLASKFPSSLG